MKYKFIVLLRLKMRVIGHLHGVFLRSFRCLMKKSLRKFHWFQCQRWHQHRPFFLLYYLFRCFSTNWKIKVAWNKINFIPTSVFPLAYFALLNKCHHFAFSKTWWSVLFTRKRKGGNCREWVIRSFVFICIKCSNQPRNVMWIYCRSFLQLRHMGG